MEGTQECEQAGDGLLGRIDQTYQPKELPLQLLGILGLSYIHLYSCQLMPVPGSACET